MNRSYPWRVGHSDHGATDSAIGTDAIVESILTDVPSGRNVANDTCPQVDRMVRGFGKSAFHGSDCIP